MLKELDVNMKHDNMIIQCDNQQTLCLVKAEIGKLSIKLKHVDIHNHWLHQEYDYCCITVCYIKSKSMIADDLTKALSLNSYHQFLN